MRLNKLLLSLLSLSFLPLCLGAVPKVTFSITSAQYGPYVAYAPDSWISVNVKNLRALSKSIYSALYVLDKSGNKIYTYTTAVCTLANLKSHDFSMKLPTEFYLSSSGMNLSFALIDSSSKISYVSYKCKIYPRQTVSINPLDYSQGNYTFLPTEFSFSSSKFTVSSEFLEFEEMLNFFAIDKYYRLTLNQYSFTYSYLGTLQDKLSYLKITPSIDCFEYLPAEQNGDVLIPLALKENDNVIYLSYKNSMYVHPKTLKMSFSPLSGFVATSYFYLPINGKKDVQQCEFFLSLSFQASNAITLSWPISYLTDINLLGPCQNSEYCIIGGITS